MIHSMTTNLMVTSIEETIAFYQNWLGFQVIASVPGKNNALQFAILQQDNVRLMIQEQENFTEEYPTLANRDICPTISLYFTIDDFEVLYQNLKDQPCLIQDLHTTFYGSEEFAIQDNTGYVLVFAKQAQPLSD